jgi:hypothetical protein
LLQWNNWELVAWHSRDLGLLVRFSRPLSANTGVRLTIGFRPSPVRCFNNPIQELDKIGGQRENADIGASAFVFTLNLNESL